MDVCNTGDGSEVEVSGGGAKRPHSRDLQVSNAVAPLDGAKRPCIRESNSDNEFELCSDEEDLSNQHFANQCREEDARNGVRRDRMGHVQSADASQAETLIDTRALVGALPPTSSV